MKAWIAAAAACIGLLSGCAAASDSDAPAGESDTPLGATVGDFWVRHLMMGLEVNPPESLQDMATRAEIVVYGRFQRVLEKNTAETTGPGPAPSTITIELSPARTLGSVRPGPIVMTMPGVADWTLDDENKYLPTDDVVLLLFENNPRQSDGLYSCGGNLCALYMRDGNLRTALDPSMQFLPGVPGLADIDAAFEVIQQTRQGR